MIISLLNDPLYESIWISFTQGTFKQSFVEITAGTGEEIKNFRQQIFAI